MIGAWTLFAFMSALAKHSYTHTTTSVTFFFQNFGGFLILLPYFFGQGASWLRDGDWGLIGLRSILGGASFFCLFYALTKIPLTDATLLNNTAPLFIPFLAAIFLKTPLRLPILLSALVGFTGVIFILKPTGDVFSFDALPALFAGVASAFVMVVMRLLAGKNPKQILFSYLCITSIASAPFAIPKLSLLPLEALPPLFCIGALFGFGQVCLTWAFRHGQPTVLAPLSYTFVVVSVLLDWALWGHTPSTTSAIGATLVLVGGIATIIYGQRKPVLQVPEES